MADSTRDLPQASSLLKVRRVVAAVARGRRSLRDAGVATGLSVRHADYYGLAATVTLGLVVEIAGRAQVTAIGTELLATREGSFEERAVLRRAILDSTSVTSIAPDLLDASGPEREALTHRLITAGLSPATAARRASTLATWRRYVLDRQGRLALAVAKVREETQAPQKRRASS
jgi:hypothetical protein